MTDRKPNPAVVAAGLATWAIFTCAHLAGWGVVQLIVAGWAGAPITLLYLWRRNLWADILCHWLIDGAGFLLMPATQA
jgi:membrane protease YdiL (CAAX protease family)